MERESTGNKVCKLSLHVLGYCQCKGVLQEEPQMDRGPAVSC